LAQALARLKPGIAPGGALFAQQGVHLSHPAGLLDVPAQAGMDVTVVGQGVPGGGRRGRRAARPVTPQQQGVGLRRQQPQAGQVAALQGDDGRHEQLERRVVQQVVHAVRGAPIRARIAPQEHAALVQVAQQLTGLGLVWQAPQRGGHLRVEHGIFGQDTQPGKGRAPFSGQRADAEGQHGLQGQVLIPGFSLQGRGGLGQQAGFVRFQGLAQLWQAHAVCQVGRRQLQCQRQAAKLLCQFESFLAAGLGQLIGQVGFQQGQGLFWGHGGQFHRLGPGRAGHLRLQGGDEGAAVLAPGHEGPDMLCLPGIVNDQQAVFFFQEGAQVRTGRFNRQGVELVVAQGMDPAAEQRKHVGLAAQGGPQDAIFEAPLHFGVIGQGSRQRRAADPPQPMLGTDGQGAGGFARLGQQAFFERLEDIRPQHKGLWQGRRLERHPHRRARKMVGQAAGSHRTANAVARHRSLRIRSGRRGPVIQLLKLYPRLHGLGPI